VIIERPINIVGRLITGHRISLRDGSARVAAGPAGPGRAGTSLSVTSPVVKSLAASPLAAGS
jgi:hypothetical protein